MLHNKKVYNGYCFSSSNIKNKMRKKLFSIVFLLILTFLAIFSAINAKAFTITTNIDTNTVCPSSTIVIETIVTAITGGSFSVSAGGTAAAFTTTVPQGFWLEPGQQGVFYSYITPSSKIAPGNYILELTITQNGVTKKARHNIIVENCHQTSIQIEPVSQTICACEEKSIKLTISNAGRYIENYELKVEGPAAQWTKLSAKSITLAPNSSTTVMAYVNTSCNAAGNYEINFIAESKSPYAKANAKASIAIVHCYDYTVSSEKIYYEMCEAEKLTIPIKIKNLGVQPNVYKINMQGPAWATIDQKQISLNNGSEETFNLIVEPPYKTRGNSTIYFEILSDYGKVLKKHELLLNIVKCYDVSVTIPEEKDKICNALSNTYEVIVKNTGKFVNTYDIILEAPEWVTINKKRITLNATQEEPIVLDVHPPYNANPNTYKIKVKAFDPISKVEASDSLDITTISLEECYKPAINIDNDTITVALDNTATAIFIIENKGSHKANYSIELSGTATRFSQINPSTISIQPGKAIPVYLYIAPPLDLQTGDYVVTVTARLKDTTIAASKTITIKVVPETEAIVEQPKPEEKPEEKPAEVQAEKKPFFYQIISWITSLFKGKNVTNIIQPTIINETILNLPPVLTKKIPDITIKAGSKEILDLSQYFADPENDTLTYLVIEPRNITITIIGSQVIIEPQKDFTGTREISFYASDGYNIVQSNHVKIIVTNSSIETNSSLIANSTETEQKVAMQKLVTPIIAVIIIAIIFIIIIKFGNKIISFFEEEEAQKRTKNK